MPCNVICVCYTLHPQVSILSAIPCNFVGVDTSAITCNVVGVDTSCYIPCDVVGVDEGEESLWKGEGVADEGGEFAVRRLARQNVQILAQLQPPFLAQRHKILSKLM